MGVRNERREPTPSRLSTSPGVTRQGCESSLTVRFVSMSERKKIACRTLGQPLTNETAEVLVVTAMSVDKTASLMWL